jgi:hypothetical protein
MLRATPLHTIHLSSTSQSGNFTPNPFRVKMAMLHQLSLWQALGIQ